MSSRFSFPIEDLSVPLCQVFIVSIFEAGTIPGPTETCESWLNYHESLSSICSHNWEKVSKQFSNNSDCSFSRMTDFVVDNFALSEIQSPNFYHFTSRETGNRPEALPSYAITQVLQGATIPAVPVTLQQLHPRRILEGKIEIKRSDIFDDLPLDLALSFRPLWISYYAVDKINWLRNVYNKVDSALTLFGKKFPQFSVHDGPCIAA
ncbi:hypothetical protein P9112_006458 [Eukaryota sp. TZLM1-RC]